MSTKSAFVTQLKYHNYTNCYVSYCSFWKLTPRKLYNVLTCLKFVTALITGEAVIRRISSDGKLIASLLKKESKIMINKY